MMMTYEDYKQLMELVQKRDEEAEEISKAIGGFFEICEIAKKEYIEKFDSKGDFMISPAAEGALGNAYAHLNQLDKAVKHLTNAADKADNNSLSPTFLVQAGEILESQGKAEEALKLYQKVKTKYFNSMQYQSIDKYIERVTK